MEQMEQQASHRAFKPLKSVIWGSDLSSMQKPIPWHCASFPVTKNSTRITIMILSIFVLSLVASSSAWISSASLNRASTALAMRRVLSPEKLQGKTVHYRSFHRLTEDSDVQNPRALEIEERYMTKLNPETNDLEPYGHRLLILREGTSKDELLRFRVHESERHTCRGVHDYAPILYLAAEEPSLVLRNKVMELSCRLGLTGLLGTLAVGMLYRRQHPEEDAEQDILPTKEHSFASQTKLPPFMSSLTLTTLSNEDEVLDLVGQNVRHVDADTAFAAREFDWRLHPRFNPVKPFYGGIISNDIPFEYPSAKELARTVAYYLEPNGRFLHFCNADTNELGFLTKFLGQGYLMNLDERYFTVESHECKPQVVDEAPKEEWEMDRTVLHEYVALLAGHHADYDGHNGEFLFPIENGKFDYKNAERPPGYFYWERDPNPLGTLHHSKPIR
jgi:hypothetical protein